MSESRYAISRPAAGSSSTRPVFFSSRSQQTRYFIFPLPEVDAGRIDLSSPHNRTHNDKLPGGILSRLDDNSVTMSLRDYTLLMSVMDDNSAANILLEKIGQKAIDDYLACLETKDIHFAGLVRDPANPDDNTATPLALAHCLDQLYRGKMVSPASREDIFTLLGTPRMSAMRAGLPHSVRIASKAGFRGAIRSTAGIVFLPKHPYVLVIMTHPLTDQTPDDTPIRLGDKISAISRLTYEYFSSLDQSAEPKVSN